MISQYTLDLLEQRTAHLGQKERLWIIDMLEGVKIQLDNPPDNWEFSEDEPRTQQQIGHLAGLMDLPREDRLEMLSMLVGYPVRYEGLPSSKDERITRYQYSVLIDYYMNRHEAYLLHEYFGYRSLRAIRAEKRVAREAARQAKIAERTAARLKRQQERARKRLSRMGTSA